MSEIVTPSGNRAPVITLDAYQDAAGSYQIPEARPEERVFGLLEEAGEVAGVFKRLFRGDVQPEQALGKLFAECGDILWYLSRVCADNGWKLSEVANFNLDKLESRKQRNVLQGSGDTR